MFRRADSWLLDALYPERTACLVCARPSRGERLCPACAAELDALRLDGAHDGWMGAAYRYQGAARKLVHQLKYGCVEDAARLLALAMADTARGMGLPPDTVVTWVSMPERRRRMRGIDHGRLLAEHVAASLGFTLQGTAGAHGAWPGAHPTGPWPGGTAAQSAGRVPLRGGRSAPCAAGG